MNIIRHTTILSVLCIFSLGIFAAQAQSRDELKLREFTNPDEMVTFDSSVEFSQALDVINEFSQEHRGKVIIDRTNSSGPIDIRVPSMHWRKAIDLILNVRGLALVERPEYFEIVRNPDADQQGLQQQQQMGGTAPADSAPPADLSTREVRIEAIFFEGNRRALQEIGVDWSTLTENVPANIGNFVNAGGGQGGGGGGGGGESGGGTLPANTFEGPFVSVNSKGAQTVSQNVFNALVNFGELGAGIEVQALFSAFEADNLGEILASPNVKVMEGEQGRIQVGQDFSIKQRDIAGNVLERFFSVGTILEVTPEVIEIRDTTFIHLDIDAQRSSAQPDPVSTIINKTQGQTQALLLNGEATAVAGLYNTEVAEVRRGIPILKDLPPWFFGLRYLFGYTSKDYQVRELVIIIKATLEPSIRDRVGQRIVEDKFEVLKDQRGNIRREIQRYEDEDYSEEMDLQDDMETQPEETEPDSTEMMQETPQDTLQEQPPVQEPEEDEVVQPEARKDSVIIDPEIQTREVQLDLGGEQEEEQADTTGAMQEEDTVGEQEEEQTAQQADVSDLTYDFYLIAASFKVESNAGEFQKKLASEGYNSRTIYDSNSGFYMVTYKGYDNLETARGELADIKQFENSNAWLYRAANN